MLNGVSGTHNKSAAHIAPGGVRALGAFHTRFGDRPGSYTIGVSYLSQQGNWITIPQVSLMQAGATPDQLRASSEVYLNLLPHAATRHSTAKAWLWAGRPTVEDYVAESGYQYSSAGGRNNRVVRLGVGQYRVECKAMTYVISNKSCWLKYAVPARIQNGDMISAVKTRAK